MAVGRHLGLGFPHGRDDGCQPVRARAGHRRPLRREPQEHLAPEWPQLAARQSAALPARQRRPAAGRGAHGAEEPFPEKWTAARRKSFPASPGILSVVRMTPRNLAWLVRRAILNTLDDGCFGYAKAAAYSALLSFFPGADQRRHHPGADARASSSPARSKTSSRRSSRPGTEDLVVQQFRVMGERPFGLPDRRPAWSPFGRPPASSRA